MSSRRPPDLDWCLESLKHARGGNEDSVNVGVLVLYCVSSYALEMDGCFAHRDGESQFSSSRSKWWEHVAFIYI